MLISVFQLLEFEPRSGEQVPLLLKMKKSPLALSKAIESGDTDLGKNPFTSTFTNLNTPCCRKTHIRDGLPTYTFSFMLVYTVVMYLKNELNRGDFFMMLRNQPVALSLYRQVQTMTLPVLQT